MAAQPDSRNITTGSVIPGEDYCDQPYVVRTDDGAWLCAMTTATGHEGASSQHIITLRSMDRGRTWSKPVRLEAPGGPENSYAVLLKVPGGRVYCFYNHNTDNVREVKTENGGAYQRVDSLGHYVFRYSDDHGHTWSAERYEVPVREFACDRQNVYGGEIRFFWNVGRPLLRADAAYFTLHKVGAMGTGFYSQSEGAVLRSANILTERNPAKVVFETLPEGDIGLRTPAGGGRIAEEQCVTTLSDGSLYCVYRSVDGHPVCAYSRDNGRHWSAPQYVAYAPGGRLFKHGRAANFVWRCANGKFLYWFHNQSPPATRRAAGWEPYADRNPAWLCCGEEQDSPAGRVIHWSQPEILLYDDDPFVRISYPDLIEERDGFYLTETQKNLGRVHRIEPALTEGLFGQAANRSVCREGLMLELPGTGRMPASALMPALPPFVQSDSQRTDYGSKDLRAGFSIELRFTVAALGPGQILLDNRTPDGRGFAVTAEAGECLRLTMCDGRTTASWRSDLAMLGPRPPGVRTHHVGIIVDGGPKLILFVVDGVLCDGGEERQFGWGRFSPHFRSAAGAGTLLIGSGVEMARVYGRALRVSEMVGNARQA